MELDDDCGCIRVDCLWDAGKWSMACPASGVLQTWPEMSLWGADLLTTVSQRWGAFFLLLS